ncbi:PHD finger protein 7-like [Cloeon dipterum]|uniref:PHD finger protein 7-like n=1 Tax=Cloeon dipterum TaxID=197152 RepID=UPI003220382E
MSAQRGRSLSSFSTTSPNRQVAPFANCHVVLQRLDEKTVNEIKNRKYCKLCNRSPSDQMLYGKMHTLNKLNVHYYCLLFACHLAQKGADTQGIFGFLEADIRKEIRRASKEKCSYCHEGGATIVCVQRLCKKVFHFPCGVENGSQHNFYNKFQSFCKQHRPFVRIPAIYAIDMEPVFCSICMEEAKKDLKCMKTLWAPCCKKNSWFHRPCVQRYALSSGYFFKCPRCNDKDDFCKAMLRYGVYVPEKDASWETEGNQFGALYERYSHCDADMCLCPQGRDEDNHSPWKIVLCGACGSQGIHVGCTQFKSPLRRWYCKGCKPIVAASSNGACSSVHLNSIAHNSNLPGPSSLTHNPSPPAPQEEAASDAERRQAALPTSRPQGYSQYSTEPIEIMESDEEVDVEILDESINILEVTSAGQAVSPARRPSISYPRRKHQFAIIVDEESEAMDDTDLEICDDVMIIS